MNKALDELGEYIAAATPGGARRREVDKDELMVWVEPSQLIKFMTFLRDDPNLLFRVLADVTAVDYPERQPRFEVVYNLLSLTHNQRLRVKVMTEPENPVPSVCGVFSSAVWFEREVWDLFGILFADHPDLRRILTDYGFEGHPLRKDFPLTGYVEVRYDADQQRVVYEPVKLTQEFRTFDFLSPWEGMLHLPGDEKAQGADAGKEGQS